MKALLIATTLTFIALPFLHGAPRSKGHPSPAKPPATKAIAPSPADNCGRILVREPGRKTPRLAECSPSVCARNARCFTACNH